MILLQNVIILTAWVIKDGYKCTTISRRSISSIKIGGNLVKFCLEVVEC